MRWVDRARVLKVRRLVERKKKERGWRRAEEVIVGLGDHAGTGMNDIVDRHDSRGTISWTG